MIYPFSILDTRTAEWKKRKNWWISNHQIQSELGRENTESITRFWESETNVSVFDPVLCELMYDWYVPKGGSILDPFAGGSVRGIVAEELGFNYTGIDISKEQITANKLQSDKPNWIVGDSRKLVPELNDRYDFVFTCPPYHDLEVYSDNPKDISNQPYNRFLTSLESILYSSTTKLKNNRFFVIVVSEIRDLGSTRDYKIGEYKSFVPSVIEMCKEHGLHFYNDMILYGSQHSASRVAKTYFDRNRKCASVHQNVLVFVKGNPDIATEIIKGKDFLCKVNGNYYYSFRHAAIDIDPIELVGTEVERRCKSRKSKYKNWQIIGKETKPHIKYSIDGVPFENPKQVSELIGGDCTETLVRNRIGSNNPQWKHWKKDSGWDITYEEMYEQWELDIRMELPTIQCEGINFLSIKDAAEHFGLSDERIRQKLVDENIKDYIYLYK
jgi:hypothetical protein